MSEYLTPLLQWVGAHPHLAGLVVLFVAFSESLAGLGLIVPGSVAMFGVGALISTGALGFWPVYAWAAAGAILGDGVSYWLGHHYHQEIRGVWPFRRYPDWLAKGEDFFRRHGGKGVLLGRFVGPIRPVVPVVAGMLNMPAGRFLAVNVVSGLAWAPLYLLPGMAFGASLALAGEIAGRLAVLLALLLVLGWSLFALAHYLYRRLHAVARPWAGRALAWAARHPSLSWLIGDLLDPARPASRALLVWLALLIGGTWLFLGVLEDVVSHDPLVAAGESLYAFLQDLRTHPGDRLMVVFSELGDAAVVGPLVLGVLGWLTWRRAWLESAYWLGAVLFGTLAVALLKGAVRAPRPTALYSGVDAYSFPSGHATMSAVVYGFLAVLVAQSDPFRARWLPYALATVLIGGVAFSRLYLGAHWLADVLGGLSLGTAWVAVMAIAHQRHATTPARAPGLALVATLILVVAGSVHVQRRMGADLERYAVRHPVASMDMAAWWQKGWRELPAYRIDLAGLPKQPLNLQWAGPLDPVRARLAAQGWREPLRLSPKSALNLLLPGVDLDRIPILPRLHNGRYAALVMARAAGPEAPQGQLVLRLWPADVRLQPGAQPLWLGSVGLHRLRRLPLVSYAHLEPNHDQALRELARLGLKTRLVTRRETGHAVGIETLLLRARDAH